MKLLECRIENFGCLSGQTFVFSDGLTAILEENGFGKSTLAAFIKAMFYGLPPAKTRKTLPERRRYMPWNGGRCGGSLSFSCREGTFKIERFFGAKEADDTLTVYDLATNRETAVFGGEIGRSVFGVDSEAYERTSYLPQKAVTLGMTDSINAKLNNLIDNTDDINNYDSAFAALENCRKAYKADKGGGGRLNEWQARLSEVEVRIAQYAEKAKEAARLEEELKEQEAQLQALRGREESLRERSGLLSLLERLREYRQDAAEADRVVTGLQPFFRDGVPTEQELAACRAAVGALGSLRAEQRGLRLPEEEQARFERLSAHRLSDEETDRITQAQARLQRCREEAAPYAVFAEETEWQRLRERFAHGVPEDEKIDRCIAALEEAARPATASHAAPPSVGKRLWWLLPAVMVLLGGVVCLALGQSIIGIVLAAAGGLGAAGAAAAYLAGRQAQARAREERDQQQRQRLAQAQAAAQQLLTAYGMSADSPLTALGELKSTAGAYRRMAQRQAEFWERKAEAEERCRQAEEELTALLQRHGADSLEQLRTEREQYAALARHVRQLEEQGAAVDQKIAAQQAQLAAFFARFALEEEPDESTREERLRERYGQLQEVLRRREQAREKIARLQAEHPELAAAGEEMPADAGVLREEWDAVRAEIEALSERITAGKSRVEHLIEEGDQVTEYESEKLRLQESLAEGQHRHALLVKTVKLMEKAKENLSTRYLQPVMSRFSAYAGEFVPELGKTAAVDTALDVMVEREGERRRREYFSEGYQCIVDICLRLALVGAMYPEDAPCLILDDPFVNLDDDKLAHALDILGRLAESGQVLYLSCHSSRMPR